MKIKAIYWIALGIVLFGILMAVATTAGNSIVRILAAAAAFGCFGIVLSIAQTLRTKTQKG